MVTHARSCMGCINISSKSNLLMLVKNTITFSNLDNFLHKMFEIFGSTWVDLIRLKNRHFSNKHHQIEETR